MASLNKVMLIGNLTRDPEVRYTPKGTAVAEISLAVNRSYNADNGEKREEVTFVEVTLWGRSAEIVGEYMKKGRPLFVEGRLQLDTWDDKQSGQKRSKLRVVAENIQLLGARDGGRDGGQDGPPPSSRQPSSSHYEEGSSQGGSSYSRGGGSSYSGGGGSRSTGSSSTPPPRSPQPPKDPDLDPDEGDDVPF